MLLTIIVALVVIVLLYHSYLKFTKPVVKYAGKTVLVTGGSTGIGLYLAVEAAKEGAKQVIILARDQKRLDEAKLEISKHCSNVITLSCDVSEAANVKKAFETLQTVHNCTNIDFAFLNQGFATPGYFIEQPDELFERQMKVNYLGTVYVAKRVVPMMLKNNSSAAADCKHLIIVGSAMSNVSFIGYSAYAPTKYALRSLAETLENELVGYNIRVHLACPVDTDTPGFAKENETKPKETAIISQAGSVEKPQEAAKFIINEVKKNSFYLNSQFIGEAIISVSRGLGGNTGCPVWNMIKTACSSIIVPFAKNDFNKVVTEHFADRKKRWDQVLLKN